MKTNTEGAKNAICVLHRCQFKVLSEQHNIYFFLQRKVASIAFILHSETNFQKCKGLFYQAMGWCSTKRGLVVEQCLVF